jgi:hypothetical protein
MNQKSELPIVSSLKNRNAGLLILTSAAVMPAIIATLQRAAWGQQLRLTDSMCIDRGEEIVEVPLKQVAGRLHSTPPGCVRWLR